MMKCINSFRSLWKRENELSAEIEMLKAEVVKTEKSLDHATPGVSSNLYCLRLKLVNIVLPLARF